MTSEGYIADIYMTALERYESELNKLKPMARMQASNADKIINSLIHEFDIKKRALGPKEFAEFKEMHENLIHAISEYPERKWTIEDKKIVIFDVEVPAIIQDRIDAYNENVHIREPMRKPSK